MASFDTGQNKTKRISVFLLAFNICGKNSLEKIEKSYKEGKLTEEQYLKNMKKFS